MGSLSLLQGNLPNTGIDPRSPALQVDYLPLSYQEALVNRASLFKILGKDEHVIGENQKPNFRRQTSQGRISKEKFRGFLPT